MFYTEEDIQPAVDLAVKVFGPQGNYSPAPFVFVTIKHPKYGNLWYGDVAGDYNTVRQLTERLQQEFPDKLVAFDTIKFVEI